MLSVKAKNSTLSHCICTSNYHSFILSKLWRQCLVSRQIFIKFYVAYLSQSVKTVLIQLILLSIVAMLSVKAKNSILSFHCRTVLRIIKTCTYLFYQNCGGNVSRHVACWRATFYFKCYTHKIYTVCSEFNSYYVTLKIF